MLTAPVSVTLCPQVHKPRTVSCPACGETRFRSSANAVQHFESGSCSSCPGRERARAAVHGFVARNQVRFCLALQHLK